MSNVSHPPHYASGKIEVIEAIEDWGLGFHRGNAVKYIARAGKKDPAKEVEDLQKAKWYLEREIERLTALKEGRASVRPNDMNPRQEQRIAFNTRKALCLRCAIWIKYIDGEAVPKLCPKCLYGPISATAASTSQRSDSPTDSVERALGPEVGAVLKRELARAQSSESSDAPK